MSTIIADYDFDLPRELIASRPLPDRSSSRMMVVDCPSGTITHRMFRDLPDYIHAGDLLVLNNSRVIPARLLAEDGKTEILVFEKFADGRWRAFTRPGKRTLSGAAIPIAGTTAHIEEVDARDGTRVVRFEREPDFEGLGHMPIPPYLGRGDDEEDRIRYQTVYAKISGSVAAPTAGLHFTPEVLAGLPHTFVTLHVGPGTFLPVRAENLDQHRMHAEEFEVGAAAARAINKATRLFLVGTTTLRVMESLASGPVCPGAGSTDIFIRPGFEFQRTSALLTNFHLPKSTLFVLVCALAGKELMREAYTQAVGERYRFFSYGDCMLILR